MQNYFLSVFILSICSFHDIYVFLISLHTFIFQLTALTSVSLKFSSNNVYSDLKFLQIALLYLKLKNNFLTLHIYT
ncbi:hypothetical protein KSF78_0006406 [Schistosoma japonicum]|nr:hypothetical protein KSF78_0006406 [Schistosoma japonicum]